MRISDYFDGAAARNPRAPALLEGERQYDFGTAQVHAHAIAHALQQEPGLAAGAHIALLSANDARVVLLQLGINRADMAWVSLHPMNSVATNSQVLDYTDAKLLFFHSRFEPAVAAMKAAAPQLLRAVCIDRESEHGPSLDAWTAAMPATRVVGTRADPAATTMLALTGGTTGPSKAAIHTVGSFGSAVAAMVHGFDLDRHTRHLAVAPLTHAAGFLGLAVAAAGGLTVVAPGFAPEGVLSAIERDRITHVILPPTAVYALLVHPKSRDTDFSSLRCIIVGSAPIAPEKTKEAVRLFGPVIHEVFGQAESGMPILHKPPADFMSAGGVFDEAALRSAGKSSMFSRVEVMNDEGRLLEPGNHGEIVLQSPMLMAGYYKRPEATSEAAAFGWHHTGDVGVMDERGFVTIVDRKKDMIVSGGYNIYSSEVEAAVMAHPGVLECAVIGVPDDKWGEAVKAVLQTKPGCSVTEEEIITLCKKTLGSVKAPKTVEVRETLPRSEMGKVLKREIRRPYWEGHWRAV